MRKFAFFACALALSGAVAVEAQAGCRPGLFSRLGGRKSGSCSSCSSGGCAGSTCTVTTTKTTTVEKKAAPSPVTEKTQAPAADKKAAPSLR